MRFAFALAGCLLLASTAFAGELYDPDYHPTVDDPVWAEGEGPVVMIDEAHNNYHTCAGRYHVTCGLLEDDGYVVESNLETIDASVLAKADILVIANALNEKNVTDDENWKTPILPAFTGAETEAIVAWVEAGGSLILIADHMPFPAAVAGVASPFGVVWQGAFAFASSFDFAHPKGDPNMINYKLSAGPSGGIGHAHPIFQGRNAAEATQYVTSFTGSAFRTKPGADVVPLLEMGEGTLLLYPMASQEQTPATPNVSGVGMLQGASLEFGAGRVVFMAEAAMFAARIADFISPGFKMGMSNADAPYNKQFTLNMFHWLSGVLD